MENEYCRHRVELFTGVLGGCGNFCLFSTSLSLPSAQQANPEDLEKALCCKATLTRGEVIISPLRSPPSLTRERERESDSGLFPAVLRLPEMCVMHL